MPSIGKGEIKKNNEKGHIPSEDTAVDAKIRYVHMRLLEHAHK